MELSHYYYLLFVGVAAIATVALMCKLYVPLTREGERRGSAELLSLALVLLLGVLAIYFNDLTGVTGFVYSDVGADTLDQYIPFYTYLIEKVREGGSLFWTFDYGLGANAGSYQSWLFDPFNLLTVPFGLIFGTSTLSPILTFVQVAKMGLSAFLFDHLLTRYCKAPLSRVLGSSLYAFAGFLTTFGQHYWLGSAVPLFTLTILLFELYLERKGTPLFIAVSLVVAVQTTWSVYVAFMSLLATALYLLLRIIWKLESLSPKTLVLEVLKMAAPVLCGLLLSGITLIPYATFLFGETARTSSELPLGTRLAQRLVAGVPADWTPAILSRVLGSSLLNTGNVTLSGLVSPIALDNFDLNPGFTYEFPLFGFSVAAFVLLFQFYHWVVTETSARTKVLVAVSSLAVVCYCFNQFLPFFFNAMVGISYRSSFVIAIPACLAMALGFEKRVLCGKANKPLLVVGALGSAAIIGWSCLNTVSGLLACLYYAVALLVVVLLAWYTGRSGSHAMPKAVVVVMLAGVIVSSSVVDAFFSTNLRSKLPGGWPNYGAEDAIDVNTTAALNYLEGQDAEFYRLDKGYAEWSPFNDSLVQRYASASAYNGVVDSDVIEFYNKLWPASIWSDRVQSLGLDPNEPEVLTFLGVKYLLLHDPVDWDWLSLETVVGDVYVYRNVNYHSIATAYTSLTSESVADAMDVAERQSLLGVSAIVDDTCIEAVGELSGGSVDMAACQFFADGDAALQGTVEVSSRAFVCFAVPNTGDWIVTADGEELETYRTNYGFIGVALPEGSHQVRLEYHMAGQRLGLIVSACGVLATVVGTVVAVRVRARRDDLEFAPIAYGESDADAR